LAGRVNPLYLVTALGDKARELGIKIHEHTEVIDIKVDDRCVKSVVTDKGEIKAKYIVNAAGFWARHVGEMVGLKIPIRAMSCHMLVTEELPEILRNNISDSFYSAESAETPRKGIEVFSIYKQTKKGNLLLGMSEGPGESKWITLEAFERLCQAAVKAIPILKDMHVNIIRSYGNLYAMTPDGLPILGEVEGLKGFILACGFCDYGIMASYMVGKGICELICSGETSISIDEFGLSRFG